MNYYDTVVQQHMRDVQQQQYLYNREMLKQDNAMQKQANKQLTDAEVKVCIMNNILGFGEAHMSAIEFVRLSEPFGTETQPHACKFHLLNIRTLPIQRATLNNATEIEYAWCDLCRKFIYYVNKGEANNVEY